MQREKSAGAVIFHKGEYGVEQKIPRVRTEQSSVLYLLLKYPTGHWDFVKGHVEKGETEEEAAMREAKEETGLDIKIVDGFKQKIKYFFYHEKDLINKEVIFFLAQAKTKEVKLSFEHQGFKWLPYEQALKQLTYKNAKGILKQAGKFLNEKKG